VQNGSTGDNKMTAAASNNSPTSPQSTNTNIISEQSFPGLNADDPLGISVITTYAQPQSQNHGRSSFSAILGSRPSAQGHIVGGTCPPSHSSHTSVSSDHATETHRRVSGVAGLSMTVCVEQPNEVIYGFNGTVTYSSANVNPYISNGVNSGTQNVQDFQKLFPAADAANPTTQGKFQTNTLTRDNLLLRGSVLRATEWCVGMCVYTGRHTKLSMNAKRAPSKLSSVDRIVNKCLLIAIVSMLVVCLLSMCLSILWVDTNKQADYLCLSTSSLTDSGFEKYSDTPGEEGGCISGSTESVLTVFTFATLYNNFVCISMYVSLEMVYICQSYFVSNDMGLYDEVTDTPAECHSSGMCADLGQVGTNNLCFG
jgi:hypothetical protein